ncbi:winged helix-turn-helix transcriptional regulator [Paenibacillus vini]|nr:winged helix-turn-helix transcriptional regulator [Paenibacillus vini]
MLAHLFQNGIMRFSELQKAIPGITKKCSRHI